MPKDDKNTNVNLNVSLNSINFVEESKSQCNEVEIDTIKSYRKTSDITRKSFNWASYVNNVHVVHDKKDTKTIIPQNYQNDNNKKVKI